jgi:peptidoglycan/LPS O-acetylase OafA/YrhL
MSQNQDWVIEGREISDRKFQIDALDGLRGLAVAIVFLSHTSNKGILLFPFADFSGTGKSGVFLFFVLSSFLLTFPFIKKGKAGKKKDFLLNYAIRRFMRIYPLYFLYLLCGLITSSILWKIFAWDEPIGIPFVLSFQEFVQHAILNQGKSVTWSILVEFRYYFVLPFLALTYSVIFKNKLIPSIALTVGLIIVSQVFWPQSEAIPNDPRLGPYLPVFFLGSLLAVIFYRWQESSWKTDRRVMLAVELLGFVAALSLIFTIPSVSSLILGKEIPFNYYHKQFILFGCLWSIFLFSCLAGLGQLRRFFELPILRYLGFISFSVYLFHTIMIDLIEDVGAGIPMKGWIILLVTIAVSHGSWVLIEKPTSKVRWVKPNPSLSV